MGKSRALADWILQLIKNRQGVGVIDPHDQLYKLIVPYVAKRGRRLWHNVVLFDPTDPEYVIGFNPLELHPGEVAERKAQFLATVVTRIFHTDENITVRMQRVMRYAFWLLILSKLTLVEFPAVLVNRNFRDYLLASIPETSKLHLFWQQEFPTQPRLVTEWIGSSLNRIDPLVTDPALKLVFGQQKSSIDFRAIMDEGKVLLVNIPKGVFGGRSTYLLGAFILAQIQLAALSRADQTRYSPRQFTLFIDEFQNYTTEDIDEILAESRKYGLALVMAHQFYEQLADSPKLQAAVLETVGNLICFRVGYQDAQQLVRDIFTPEIDRVKDVRVRKMPTGIDWFPYTTEKDMVWRPLNEIWEQEARELTSLPDRFFWYKQRGGEAAQRLRTRNVPDLPINPQLREAIQELRELSAKQYAREKTVVNSEIDNRLHTQFALDSDVPAEYELLE